MKMRTICLALGQITPGMELARPVTDDDNNMLVVAGTILDLQLLDRLTRRGIKMAVVQVPDQRDEETITSELEMVRERLEYIFRGQSNPCRNELYASILQYRRDCLQ